MTHDAIDEAVELLKARHHVRDGSAFTMLVQASVDTRLSVADAALGLIEESRGTPRPRR